MAIGLSLLTSYVLIAGLRYLQLHWMLPPFFGYRAVAGLPHLLPYALPLLVFRPQWRESVPAFALALGISVLLLALQSGDIALRFHRDVRALQGPLDYNVWLQNVVGRLGGAAAQELYYRGLLIPALRPLLGPGAIAVSAALFVLEHRLQHKATSIYTRSDYAVIGALGLGLATVFYVTHAFWACAVAHVLFNTPGVVADALRVRLPSFKA